MEQKPQGFRTPGPLANRDPKSFEHSWTPRTLLGLQMTKAPTCKALYSVCGVKHSRGQPVRSEESEIDLGLDGEITQEEAKRKRARVKLQALGRPSHIKGFDELPVGLRDLVTQSFALHDRIVQLDRAMNTATAAEQQEAAATNPVGVQFKKLELAFSRPN